MGCEDFLYDLRRKLKETKDNLTLEKKTLSRAREAFTEEKDKLMAERAAQETKIRRNEDFIKQKGTQVERLKKRYEDICQRIREIEEENANMEKKTKKLKKELEEESKAFAHKKADLESSLSDATKKMDCMILSNKWMKTTHENELRLLELDWENKIREEIQILRDEFDKRMETYDDNYWDLLRNTAHPKQQLVKMLRENLHVLTIEYEEQVQKNAELEQEIKVLKSVLP